LDRRELRPFPEPTAQGNGHPGSPTHLQEIAPIKLHKEPTGILELWNIGIMGQRKFLRDLFFNFFPTFHYSNVPLFHFHS
jgi:hypothetical protein